ncbi:PREDICTED: kelch-like protein 11 [Pygoscelis adeliae]|uniref:kelch-like protein 11 n=1 Tax=Pygoscelis adeliae TaxID=9238 RepID=UPI0004F50B56|nr:PREDICTED: kelch-like protein 11 [Pygoscelis adeliae]
MLWLPHQCPHQPTQLSPPAPGPSQIGEASGTGRDRSGFDPCVGFLLTRLKEFCGEFLKKKLNLSNCVAVHSLAHMYSLNQLALKAQDMIRRNFHKVIQDEEFYTLPFHLIRDWLSDSEITVDSEEILFETVLKWVQKNPEERERYFEDLFKLLRLSQMKPTYLTRHVKSERLVSSNEACVKLVSEAVESHALRSENLQSGNLQHSACPVALLPRFGQNMDVIMVIGGVSEGGDYLSECVGYFIDEDRQPRSYLKHWVHVTVDHGSCTLLSILM